VQVYQPIKLPLPLNFTQILNANLDLSKLAKLLDDIPRCLVLDQKDRYLSYLTLLRYFYTDFRAFCLVAIKDPKVTPSGFLD
jgi:hypothetical protein